MDENHSLRLRLFDTMRQIMLMERTCSLEKKTPLQQMQAEPRVENINSTWQTYLHQDYANLQFAVPDLYVIFLLQLTLVTRLLCESCIKDVIENRTAQTVLVLPY